MSYRNSKRGRDRDDRPWRAGEAFPERDDHGLHGQERRQYRGRESYEQQTRGGEGGRSGMFPERAISTDNRERYRNNADEDARGYQTIARRAEFVSADRDRPDYGRYARPSDRDYDDARYSRDYRRSEDPRDYDEARIGFDARDYHIGADPHGTRGYDYFDYEDDYSHTDYGARDYHRPSFERYERYGREYDPYPGAQQRQYARPELGYGRPAPQRPANRGPRGYKRSDERLREEVCERLGRDWDVDASDIEVNIANSEVTLSGSIEDRRQKFRAEHLADGVWGVTEVHNQLRVKREREQSNQQQLSSRNNNGSQNQNRSS
jgi:hypothetical protein